MRDRALVQQTLAPSSGADGQRNCSLLAFLRAFQINLLGIENVLQITTGTFNVRCF